MSSSSVLPRVDSGRFGCLANLVPRIRIHKNYTDALGTALSSIPVQSAGVDLSTMQPALDVDFQSGHPRILWTSRGMDALELEADHGDGHFALFTIDTTAHPVDTTPLSPPGSVVQWKYRDIYRVRDERVSNWRPVLAVSVKGM